MEGKKERKGRGEVEGGKRKKEREEGGRREGRRGRGGEKWKEERGSIWPIRII